MISTMPDVMIDLETMGTRHDAPILAIGAVAFDMTTGTLGERFYTTVDLASSVAMGSVIDPDTVMWWLKQNDQARAGVYCGARLPARDALMQFAAWMYSKCAPPDTLRPWGNGANFDPIILEEHYRKADLDVPWKFWNVRCCRTLAGTRPDIKRQNNGTKHNALDDAVAQAEQLIAVFQATAAQKPAIPDGWNIRREGGTIRIEHPSIGRAVTSSVSRDPNDVVLHHLAESLLEDQLAIPVTATGPAATAKVPEGWRLVPIKPTETMVVMGFESWPDVFFCAPEAWEAYEAMTGCQKAAHRARLCYTAMLAAAPQPDVEK